MYDGGGELTCCRDGGLEVGFGEGGGCTSPATWGAGPEPAEVLFLWKRALAVSAAPLCRFVRSPPLGPLAWRQGRTWGCRGMDPPRHPPHHCSLVPRCSPGSCVASPSLGGQRG